MKDDVYRQHGITVSAPVSTPITAAPVSTPITAAPTWRVIHTCSHCGKKNYTPCPGWQDGYVPNDVKLFDIRIPHGTTDAAQTLVLVFCADCLQLIADAIFRFRRGL